MWRSVRREHAPGIDRPAYSASYSPAGASVNGSLDALAAAATSLSAGAPLAGSLRVSALIKIGERDIAISSVSAGPIIGRTPCSQLQTDCRDSL